MLFCSVAGVMFSEMYDSGYQLYKFIYSEVNTMNGDKDKSMMKCPCDSCSYACDCHKACSYYSDWLREVGGADPDYKRVLRVIGSM